MCAASRILGDQLGTFDLLGSAYLLDLFKGSFSREDDEVLRVSLWAKGMGLVSSRPPWHLFDGPSTLVVSLGS